MVLSHFIPSHFTCGPLCAHFVLWYAVKFKGKVWQHCHYQNVHVLCHGALYMACSVNMCICS